MIEFFLNFRLSIFSWAISQHNVSHIERLDPEHQVKLDLRKHALLRAWIKPKLEQIPYWKKGLYQYGVSSLELRDIRAAFFCGRALLELSKKNLAEELLRKVYLASGEPEKALEISRTSEDIAACKLAMGDKEHVLNLISD